MAASPAKTMIRRRVSSSAKRKFPEARWRWRLSSEKAVSGAVMGVVVAAALEESENVIMWEDKEMVDVGCFKEREEDVVVEEGREE